MTLGKRQRTEKVNFLGQPYRVFTCVGCKKKIEDFGLNTDRKCPRCVNEVDILDAVTVEDGCNCYSCQAGRAMELARDKSKSK